MTRILVIGLSNIGDAVLMSPVVARLRRRYPSAELTLVVGERARLLFEHDPRVTRLLNVEDYRGALGRLRLAALVWTIKPDALIDLRSTALPLVWRPWRLWRYVRPVPAAMVHRRDRHLWKMERQLGLPPARETSATSGDTILFPENSIVSPEGAAYADKLLSRWGVASGAPLVVMCPGARSHIKRWPAERFAQLADRLIAEAGAEIVLTGEPDEAPIIEEVVQAMQRRAHSAVGTTSIPVLAGLMRRARLVITNDSASLHVACASGAPVVAVFGPTNERAYGPTGPRDRVVRRRLFCAPCEQALCRFHHECMRFVAVEDMFQAAARVLNTHAVS